MNRLMGKLEEIRSIISSEMGCVQLLLLTICIGLFFILQVLRGISEAIQ